MLFGYQADKLKNQEESIFGDVNAKIAHETRVPSELHELRRLLLARAAHAHAQHRDRLRAPLQHAAVDMFIALEQARSITMYATMMADSDDARERGRAISAAKAEIGRGGRLAGENAIQLHGGVGMTMEYAIGHYFKRITMIDILFGDTDHHLAKLTAQGGLFEAA